MLPFFSTFPSFPVPVIHMVQSFILSPDCSFTNDEVGIDVIGDEQWDM